MWPPPTSEASTLSIHRISAKSVNTWLRYCDSSNFAGPFFSVRIYTDILSATNGPNCGKYGENMGQSSSLSPLCFTFDICLLRFEMRRLKFRTFPSRVKIREAWAKCSCLTYCRTSDIGYFLREPLLGLEDYRFGIKTQQHFIQGFIRAA